MASVFSFELPISEGLLEVGNRALVALGVEVDNLVEGLDCLFLTALLRITGPQVIDGIVGVFTVWIGVQEILKTSAIARS